MVLGVRLDGRRSARFDDLARAGLLVPWPEAIAPPGAGHLPAAELLAAHALVHAIAQHGFAAGYPGLWLVADLQDLGGASEPEARHLGALVAPWIGAEVSAEETGAAFELTRGLARGGGALVEISGNARRLLEHMVGAALDPEYGWALRGRQFDSPLSDRPIWLARLIAAVRALSPAREAAEGGLPEPGLHYLARIARRPADLARRWVRSRAARRAIAGVRRPDDPGSFDGEGRGARSR